jgi:hypothetical protein
MWHGIGLKMNSESGAPEQFRIVSGKVPLEASSRESLPETIHNRSAQDLEAAKNDPGLDADSGPQTELLT